MNKIGNINYNRLLKLFAKGLALTTVNVVLIASVGCASADEMFPQQLIELGIEISEESEIGTIDEEHKKNDFSLAYCGNHTTGLNRTAKKILEKTNVPTGIVITPNATTLGEIYLDVDYVKSIIQEYQVGYPICLNVDTMYSLPDNSQGDIDVMINAFAEKLCVNGCIVKVIGSEENISKIGDSEYYGKGVIIDEDTTELSQMYDLLISGTYVYSNRDYDSEILSNNYHTTSLLVDDIKHLVSDGESLTIISEQYGISVNNLRIYNNLDSDIIFPGQIIKIPNRYDTELMINTTTVENEVDIYQYYKGIDVSEFQGEIDWELARTKIDFAIIRIADAYNRDSDGNIIIDERFRYNIEECNRLGIPVGVYIYTRADNEEELNEELRFVLENIEPYNITLPIYRDLEGSRAEQLITSESDRLNQVALTDRFCSTIEQAGYPSGIYLHKKYLGYIPELGNKYSIWAQGGWCYSTECDFDDMQYALEEDGNGGLVPFDLTYAVNIFQSTEQGLAHELGIQSNYVDFNYVDQEFVNNLIKKFDKDGNVYVLKRN